MITSKCPFLGRVSSTFLQKAGGSIGVYGQNCPVMSRLLHTTVNTATKPYPIGSSPQTLGKNNTIYIYIIIDALSFTIPLSFSCPERLYVSIHAGLPRSSTTLGHCPFHSLMTRNLMTSTALLTSNSDSNSQKAQPKEGIIPQGEFEFSNLYCKYCCFYRSVLYSS